MHNKCMLLWENLPAHLKCYLKISCIYIYIYIYIQDIYICIYIAVYIYVILRTFKLHE